MVPARGKNKSGNWPSAELKLLSRWRRRLAAKMYLPAGNAVARGLAVGSAYGASSGLVELFGTTFRVTNDTGGYIGWVAITNAGNYTSAPAITIIENTLNIYHSGDILCHVGAASAGLDIASSLPGDFLIYDGGQLNIYYDAAGFTYIGLPAGIIPEPTSLALLALAGLALIRRR